MGYPLPFLEYYWYANRSELEPDVRVKLFPADGAGASGADAADADAPDAQATATIRSPAPSAGSWSAAASTHVHTRAHECMRGGRTGAPCCCAVGKPQIKTSFPDFGFTRTGTS